MKKILIVDDSLVYRHALTSALSEEKDLSIFGTAKNGQEALDIIVKNSIDLITLDIEMPIMNGFELIEKLNILPTKPRIIVFTSLDATGAGNAIKALQLGADDFVTKIAGTGDISKSINEIRDIITPKIKSLINLKKSNIERDITKPVQKIISNDTSSTDKKKLRLNYDYIFLGASTGGPEALRFLFNNLNGKKMPPIFVVQHMPPIYTSYLAKALNEKTSYEVVEAKNGDLVTSGKCYIAPGDYHMTIAYKNSEMRIVLNQEYKECFVRPSVNYLFRSAENLSSKSLFIVLTGMGNDGLAGLQYLVNKNNKVDVLIQDEESSVVWGMPGEIFQKDIYSEMQSLNNIKERLMKLV